MHRSGTVARGRFCAPVAATLLVGGLLLGAVPQRASAAPADPPVVGRLEIVLGSLEIVETAPVLLGVLTIADSDLPELRGAGPFYSSRSGKTSLSAATATVVLDRPAGGGAPYMVLEVPTGGTDALPGSPESMAYSAPFSTGGWKNLTVLARLRRVEDGTVYTAPATHLDIRNGPDEPFFQVGVSPLGVAVVAAEARAAFRHTASATEVLGFSIYLSR